MRVELSEKDLAAVNGQEGDGAALAMRILLRMAESMGAGHLLDITSAHIDGCLYHGQAGVDFACRLAEGGARVKVPTTLNVSYLDLLHPELYRGDDDSAAAARRQMEAYVAMGCRETWTCAPYQLADRPHLGEQIAWAESNAIVFANSVLGARTNRYGDFIDICAAVTGRAPAVGLHLDPPRRATLVLDLDGLPHSLLSEESFYPVLGHLMGGLAGAEVAAIVGLPGPLDEDRLKALGAAAASSGRVAMFHAVGLTPEAPTLEAATGGGETRRLEVSMADVRRARDQLSTTGATRIDAVSIGTPHASLHELELLAGLMAGREAAVPFYVNTGRGVLAAAEEKGWAENLRRAGVSVVTDTCTYITPILDPTARVVMTNSGKWAFYAPGNLGVEVVFGTTTECVESAVAGEVWRDGRVW
jgi:predicted aconitase